MPTLDRPILEEARVQRRLEAAQSSREAETPAISLSVADLIKRFTPEFIEKYRPSIAAHVGSTLARLGFCRTAAMGGRTYRCGNCQSQVSMYNSCADRHCPQCSGARRGDWLDKAAKLLLRGVTYFQVVFTLPDKLSSVILGNRATLYRTLMQTAAASLRARIELELGMQSASLLVLHTWNQLLEHHPHVHALVPGHGPSLDGGSWVESGQTRSGTPFLVDNKRLSSEFSRRFIDELNRLHRTGQLQLEGNLAHLKDNNAWAEFTQSLTEHAWCVFVEPPPSSESKPQHVLKYLARYMTGGPISDSRIVSYQDQRVTFLAREKKPGGSKKQVPVTISGPEFTRRWSMHILPKGFTKTRCYGGFSSTRRAAFIALCKQLCHQPTEAPPTPTDEPEPDHNPELPTCERCQQPMELVAETERPPWRDLFYGPNHHAWFES